MSHPSPSLLEALDDVGARVERAPHVLLLLDFDGTLAPIAPTPDAACMPDGTREVVAALARCAACTVGVVSGRALADVRANVGIEEMIYAGNHGLEIAGPGLAFEELPTARATARLAVLGHLLAAQLAHVAGAIVEPKGPTASVHYRLVRPEKWVEVEAAVRGAVPEHDPDLVVTAGKMVWELRPRVAWNKGSAVRWVRERLGVTDALAVYLGDDRTDEDAFAAIGPYVTARVGTPGPTRAGFRLADTNEVAEFLRWLARTLGGKRGAW